MAQGSRNVSGSRNRSINQQRWDRFTAQVQKFKGGINASLTLTIIIHLAKIVVGSMYIHDCPVDKKIPIFLIVAGTVGVVSKVLTLLKDYLIKYFKVKPILSFIGTFEFIWFICGFVWVMRVLTPSYDPLGGDQYCNKTVYVFSLVYLWFALGFILLVIGIALVCLCCFCCCAGLVATCCPSEDDKDGEAAEPV